LDRGRSVFLFGTVIIAVTINVIANLLNR